MNKILKINLIILIMMMLLINLNNIYSAPEDSPSDDNSDYYTPPTDSNTETDVSPPTNNSNSNTQEQEPERIASYGQINIGFLTPNSYFPRKISNKEGINIYGCQVEASNAGIIKYNTDNLNVEVSNVNHIISSFDLSNVLESNFIDKTCPYCELLPLDHLMRVEPDPHYKIYVRKSYWIEPGNLRIYYGANDGSRFDLKEGAGYLVYTNKETIYSNFLSEEEWPLYYEHGYNDVFTDIGYELDINKENLVYASHNVTNLPYADELSQYGIELQNSTSLEEDEHLFCSNQQYYLEATLSVLGQNMVDSCICREMAFEDGIFNPFLYEDNCHQELISIPFVPIEYLEE